MTLTELKTRVADYLSDGFDDPQAESEMRQEVSATTSWVELVEILDGFAHDDSEEVLLQLNTLPSK